MFISLLVSSNLFSFFPRPSSFPYVSPFFMFSSFTLLPVLTRATVLSGSEGGKRTRSLIANWGSYLITARKDMSNNFTGFCDGIRGKDTSRHCLSLLSPLWLLFCVTKRNKQARSEHNYFGTDVSPCTHIDPICTPTSPHLQPQQNGEASLSIRLPRHIMLDIAQLSQVVWAAAIAQSV